ncbi:hypothetical protein JW711_05710 [Candidatus Woesearchaeota archaeon]|nr:hypothetical protein [Candidatus Woesearchaeota archaeon]
MLNTDILYNGISNAVSGTVSDLDVIRALESLLDIYKESNKKEGQYFLPLELFSERRLGVLEIVIKYLHEGRGLSYGRIADILCRDDRTIWASYHSSVRKLKSPLRIGSQTNIMIPSSIFNNRVLGPLEALVIYLKRDCGLSFKEISLKLKREYCVIWLSYRKGTDKLLKVKR